MLMLCLKAFQKGSKNREGEVLLLHDTNIVFTSGTHIFVMVVAAMVMVGILGTVLYFARFTLNLRKKNVHNNPMVRLAYGALYDAYKPEHIHFETFMLLRRALAIIMGVAFARLAEDQDAPKAQIGTSLQVGFQLVISIAYFVLLWRWRPFKDEPFKMTICGKAISPCRAQFSTAHFTVLASTLMLAHCSALSRQDSTCSTMRASFLPPCTSTIAVCSMRIVDAVSTLILIYTSPHCLCRVIFAEVVALLIVSAGGEWVCSNPSEPALSTRVPCTGSDAGECGTDERCTKEWTPEWDLLLQSVAGILGALIAAFMIALLIHIVFVCNPKTVFRDYLLKCCESVCAVFYKCGCCRSNAVASFVRRRLPSRLPGAALRSPRGGSRCWRSRPPWDRPIPSCS